MLQRIADINTCLPFVIALAARYAEKEFAIILKLTPSQNAEACVSITQNQYSNFSGFYRFART